MKGTGRIATAAAAKRMGQIRELTEKIKQFRDERDWLQFHNHKDMALSLVLEATEVLEHFQWKTPEEVERHAKEQRDELADEVADVAMFLLELADNLEIDLAEAVEKKLKKNALKYPVEKAHGSARKYTQL